MPKIKYLNKNFNAERAHVVTICNQIINEYQRQGFRLTLRQLYYRLVAGDLFPDSRKWVYINNKWVRHEQGTKNAEPNYTWLGEVLSDARLAGLVDWNAIEDRTRELGRNPHWDTPSDVINSAAAGYQNDLWRFQPVRPECFLPQTPLVTKTGIVPIASAEVGDFSLTHTGNYHKITKIIRNFYQGEVLKIKAAGLLPIEVTPLHPFWAKECLKEECYLATERLYAPLQWIASEKLKKFDLISVPLLPGKSRKSSCKKLTLKGGKRSNIFQFSLDVQFLRVCGLYVAEGNICPDKRTVQFTFHRKETAYAQEVIDWAEKIHAGYSTAFGKGTRIVYVYGQALANWFSKEFGNGSKNKCLPPWLMHDLEHRQMEFLHFYFNGDGCFWDESTSSIVAGTVSSSLARQIQLMFLWMKISCSLHIVNEPAPYSPRYEICVSGAPADSLASGWGIKIPIRGIKRSRRYNHITFSYTHAFFPIRKITRSSYQGFVHNLEVEGDHSYCVPVAVHNCWVEKDALEGVVASACQPLDVPYFSCRGYTSLTAIWEAAQRMIAHRKDRVIYEGKHERAKGQNFRQKIVIFHLGDHDPSGIDMTRDIKERLELFIGEEIDLRRIALNLDQVQEYEPPPNPAKTTDSRFKSYSEMFGNESWELDALEPSVLVQLIQANLRKVTDKARFQEAIDIMEKGRDELKKIAANYEKALKAVHP